MTDKDGGSIDVTRSVTVSQGTHSTLDDAGVGNTLNMLASHVTNSTLILTQHATLLGELRVRAEAAEQRIDKLFVAVDLSTHAAQQASGSAARVTAALLGDPLIRDDNGKVGELIAGQRSQGVAIDVMLAQINRIIDRQDKGRLIRWQTWMTYCTILGMLISAVLGAVTHHIIFH